MGVSHQSEFWSGRDEYHDLAEEYVRNIELQSPGTVTGRGVTMDFCAGCSWCATAVIYPTYRGESIK